MRMLLLQLNGFFILAGTVLNSRAYSFDDAAFPIATSFYVGIGFQHLINARLSGIDKVFWPYLSFGPLILEHI